MARRLIVGRLRVIVPLLVLVALVVLFVVLTPIYTDLLFYRSVNFSKVFTTVLWTRVLLFVLFGLVMAVVIGTNLVLAYRLRPPLRPLSVEQQNLERYRTALEPYLLAVLLGVTALFGLAAGLSASGRWRTWLQWVNGQKFGVTDPQFHRDVSYYAFTYPFQRFLLGFLLSAVVLSLVVTTVTHYLFGGIRIQSPRHGDVRIETERVSPAAKAHLSVLLGLLALLKAWAYYLDRFGLVFSSRGVVSTGAGYTDVHAVLPAKLILLFISLACAGLFIYNIFQRGWTLPLLGAGILVLSAVVIGGIYPAIVQQLQVKPNEASRESPYIARNIAATRDAYGIDSVMPQNYPVATQLTATAVQNDVGTVSNVRLLDPNKLSKTFKQLQQLKGYYGFPDTLDIDRYTVGSTTQDYVVSVRELDQSGLAPSQKNWINEHLTYTHGKGFVAAPANKVKGGKPDFQVGDLPQTGPFTITENQVYFGEMSPDYSIVGTKQQEIDGPGAAQGSTTTTTYTGDGGVSIGSWFDRAVFAARFGEKNILFSSDITQQSRILYERNPRDRVAKVAPWLTLDGDPYPAVVNGRITWILDGYTTSDGYPYSERNALGQVTADAVTGQNRAKQGTNDVNYIRNSVKATVDAYDGTVTLYAFDESDPVLKTWMRAFPGTVKPAKAIPAELRAHFRYPEDLFKVQRDVLADYHVTDPRAFYSQEDFWAVSPAPDDQNTDQPPFYVYSQLPGHKTPSFNLTSPLISRRSSKLAAYVAVSSDPDDYGAFQVLRLPQGVTISGPSQMQSQIMTSSASKLTLWRGGLSSASNQTIPGNLLTLPVADGLMYVEPFYVQASGSASYPILQGVAVAFGDTVALEDSLQQALDEVFGPGAGDPASGAGSGSGATAVGSTGSPTEPPASSASPNPSLTPAPGTTLSPDLVAAIGAAQAANKAGQQALAKNPPDWSAFGVAQGDLAKALASISALSGSSTPSPSATPAPSASAAPSTTAAPSATASPTTGPSG
ncbi:UPF0182 family protein [Frankia sp. AgB1.9]|uniref:UPF0182 family membrane protein n=1 Tax=unclassified Frankia TaxID=2632575 RepID=UPI001931A007|nr:MULTISPECIES: UPF0182 family protein [unclassified Frankia]MBL7494193.1 UPF0182 family protein [Frankia sp. AgW1.1]MBL7552337.1 UPF0182 family protein [Frankia sp. AgB1.9]MBL7625500.1 UPF0182 family protein [Frankia sp. AgB1.8]